jgi:MFS family permease
MATSNSTSFLSCRAAWAVLLVIILVALVIVLTPVWIIQPFAAQSERGLKISYIMRSWSPILTPIILAVAVTLVVWLWRGSRRWWKKAFLVVVLIPVFAATWFARQNHFEWMFNPIVNAAYAKTSEAAFVADTDMVMAVENNGEAVAYPVRLMAYHHLVQDNVGGTPIIATY